MGINLTNLVVGSTKHSLVDCNPSILSATNFLTISAALPVMVLLTFLFTLVNRKDNDHFIA